MDKELTYDGLPVEIQERMLLEQEKQGNERNPEVFRKYLQAGENFGGFIWDETNEGFNFWSSILTEGNFDAFFKRYPKKEEELLELENEEKPSSLNLIELLTNAPSGLPLYSTVLGPCTLVRVENDLITVTADKETYFRFTSEGKLVLITAALLEVSECVLFPSKDQRDWSKFVVNSFKPGELVWAKDAAGIWIPRRYAYLGLCYTSQVDQSGPTLKPTKIRAWDDCPFKDTGHESKVAQKNFAMLKKSYRTSDQIHLDE